METAVVKSHMEKSVASLKTTFLGIRTSRASANLLDKIKAEVYGVLTPIQQLGNISAPEPRILTIQVWDKASVKPLEKAIGESGIGVSINVEGQVLRLVFPELTQERREDLARYAAKCAEEIRVAIRNIRREAMEELKKLESQGKISEDEMERRKKEVQKVTEEFTAKVDEMLEMKRNDIMHV